MLDSTGLYWYSSRFYDPSVGRFLSPDTLVPDPKNPQALNRYSYVYNNPLRYNDPSGHAAPIHNPFSDTRIDISGWPDLVKSLVVGGSLLVGWHVDTERDVITGPTDQEYAEMGVDSLAGPLGGIEGSGGRAGGRMLQNAFQKVRTSAIGQAANDFVNKIAAEAEKRVLQESLQGTIASAMEAAQRGEKILPGLFKYGTHDSIEGYQLHHLWPKGLGGPEQGWGVYAKNFHTSTGNLQQELNSYLMKATNLTFDEMKDWAKRTPDQVLPHLRAFYSKKGIPFPY